MELQKKYRLAQIVIVGLCILSIAMGVALSRAQKESSLPMEKEKMPKFDSFDSFFNSFNHRFQNDGRHSFDMLDQFFNDGFFAGKSDPFKEMERMQKQMKQEMDKSLRETFDSSWNSWFGNRFMGGDALDMNVYETKNAYVYRFTIPNLKEQKLDVNVSKEGITIQGDFTQNAEKMNPQRNVVARQEKHSSVYRNFPIPEDADVQKAEVNNQGGQIVVKVPRISPVS